MSNQHLAATNVHNPMVLRPTVGQERLTKCRVDVYKDLIAKQPEVTGECWVYKDKYTLNKKHEQINNRKRKAPQSDTVDNESDQLDASDTEEPVVSSENKKRVILWKIRFQCHRKARSEKKKIQVIDDENDEYDEDGMQRRPIQKKSKNIGCKAQLMVYCYEDDEDNVEFAYVNEHNGHVPGSIGDVQYLRKSKELNERILEELHKGYNVRDVKRFLQREYQHVAKGSRFGHINTVDVYNILCKYREELCCLDKDDFTSVKKQLEVFRNLQYHVWIDVTDGENSSERLTSKDFAFGFVAPWQLAYFEKAQFVSLDATHDVSKYKDGVLYTMVVRDPIAGRGVPITYLLTNDLSSKPLLGWFRSLATIGLNPQRFTIDNSLPEDNAIVQVWPGCSIQHCIWHVMRAWMQNVQAKIHGSIGRTPSQAKTHIRPRLKELMYEKNTERFHALLSNFLTEFQDSQREFITYFKTYYVDKWDGRAYERWNCSYQPHVFHAMSTNNYVESWHNQLKTVYLKRKRTHRLDVLINLLVDDVSFDVTEEVKRLSVNVGRMGSTERRLRANEIKAEKEQRSRSPSSIIHVSDSEYSVVSFNNNAHNAIYIVKADNNQVASCTCPDYQRHFFPCKHMFYVELNDPSVTVRPQITNHRVWDQEMTVSTISSSTSHHIDHPNPSTNKDQLQAAINRLVSRANALKRRVNRSAIASNNNNNSNINNIIQQIDALTQNISNVDSDLDDVLSLPPNSNFQLQ